MNLDKESWGPGPWQSEPDRKEWRHKGLPCLIVRNHLGALCGYVAVSPGHPWHRKHYDDIDADVHGGLTFSAPCREGSPICHVPQPGESDDVWWVGFDCNHGEDLAPGIRANLPPELHWTGDVYRNINYVQLEVEDLARQALEAVEDPNAQN